MTHYGYNGPKWIDFSKPKPKKEQVVEKDPSVDGKESTETPTTESTSPTTNTKTESDLVIDKTEPDVFIESNVVTDVDEEGTDQQKDKPKKKRRKRKKTN